MESRIMLYDDTVGTIDDRISELADSIIAGKVDTSNMTTLTYYGNKLIQAMDRLDREAQIRRDQFVAQQRITKKQDRLKEALSVLSSKIQSLEGVGSVYFSDLSDIDLVNKNPIVRSLDKYRIKGLNLNKAIKLTAGDLGRSETVIIKYVKDNDIDERYPDIDDTSPDYALGQRDARSLGTSNARLTHTADNMYNQQMRYLCKCNDYGKLDINSYIAGFNNVANKCYDRNFINGEKEKSKIIIRSLDL